MTLDIDQQMWCASGWACLTAPEAELVELGSGVHLQLASEGITGRSPRRQIRPGGGRTRWSRGTPSPASERVFTRLGTKPEFLDCCKSQMALLGVSRCDGSGIKLTIHRTSVSL